MAKKRPPASRPQSPTPVAPEPAVSTARSGPTGLVVALVMIVVIVVAGAAWWLMRAPAFSLQPDANRNVLLITIDTLRADAVGAYGGGAATPNLDGLAARGARFDFAHSHAVVTLPSHASILTGRYPYEHGIRDNTGYRLPATTPTIATRLKSRGLATGAFVSGFPLDHRFGLAVGFDMYDDALSSPTASEVSERERKADATVASAIKWIDAQSGQWFTWVHVYDPHALYDPPDEFKSRYPASPYLGEVAWTDSALGPLFDTVAAGPRPTLVIVTSDHGEGLGDHGELTHGVFAYESVLHVPLIIAELGGDLGGVQSAPTRGQVISTPVRHVDLLPTILDALGDQSDSTGDIASGTSLRPVINDGSTGDRPSYFEAMTATVQRGWAPLRGVVAGRDKYIDLPITELYNLSEDAQELRNLASTETERTQVLFNTLKGFDMTPPGTPQQESADTLERLRSLGYIGGGSAQVREEYTEDDDPKKLIELDQMLTRASQAQREGRAAEAVSLYQQVIAIRADTEDAYRKLALVYWRAGQAADAIATLEAALQAGITQSEVRIKLAQYLAESGQPNKAIELLEAMTGDDPDAIIGLGNAYLGANRPRDAIRTFEHLLTIDPNNGLAYENIGITKLQGNDLTGAEASLRQALDLDPTLSGAWTALGVVLRRTDRIGEAIAAWQRAVAEDSFAFDALFNLTINLAETGRAAQARAAGERFIATAPPSLADDIATIRSVLAQIR